jgi:hypothetical protein
MPLDVSYRSHPLALMHRPVVIELALLDDFALRTDDGHRLTLQWGEPDENGVYIPTLTMVDDGKVVIDREVLALLERRAGGVD